MFNIYFHVAVMGDWKVSYDIINDYLNKSGILYECDSIIYCISGDYLEAQKYIKSNNLCWVSKTIDHYEFPTLNLLLEDATENILYIHTKGASTGVSEAIKDWIKIMCYFNITKFRTCLYHLETYDVVGIDYHYAPFRHYSGNFWWTKASYLKRNHKPLYNEDRHAAERWVCCDEGNYKSLYQTEIDVYKRHLYLYPEEKYIND